MHETYAKSTEEAMLTKLGTITVQVSDQDKALKFYTQKLWFEKRKLASANPPVWFWR